MSNLPDLQVARGWIRSMKIKSTERQVPIGAGREDYGLSPFEMRIIALLLAGYTTQESAREMAHPTPIYVAR